MAATSARMTNEAGFALVFRLGIMPMALFSGAFFPIEQLPDGDSLDRLHHADLARRRAVPDAHDRHRRRRSRLWVMCSTSPLFAVVGWVLAVRYFGRRLIV